MSHHGDHVQCDHSKGRVHAAASQTVMENTLMMKEEWRLEDWEEIYEKVEHTSSKGHPSEQLVTYVKELLPSEPARVLVPLCGKSPDLRWLYERGNTVVGVEGIEKPVREFFEKYPDLQHSVEDLPFGKVYKSQDERLQVFVCDVTQIPEGALGKFDAAFDWGSYTAIRPADRPRYAEVMLAAMGENFRYFLEVCHDGPPGAKGLPHSIPFRTIKLEFGVSLKLRVLATKDISEEWGVDSFFNSFILMSDKEL